MNQEAQFVVCTQCFTYNQASYIEDALRGFSIQETAFPIVTLVVDDASTDGEPEKLRRWAQKHLHIESLKNLDYGEQIVGRLCDNINSLFVILLLKENHYSQAKPKERYLTEWLNKSKYYSICEGDDYWISPNKLQQQVEYMESHPSCTLCHTGFRFYYQNNNSFKDYCLELGRKKNRDIKVNILDNNLYRIQTNTTLFRKRDYDYIINLEPILFSQHFVMGDTQMWIMLLTLGEIGYTRDVTSVYRVLDSSASHSKNPIRSLRFYLSVLEMRLYLGKKYVKLPFVFSLISKARFYKALLMYLPCDSVYRPVYNTILTRFITHLSRFKLFVIISNNYLSRIK